MGVRIPHPTQFNAHANDIGLGDTKLQRVESDVNIQAMINVIPHSDNVRVRVFGGPTFFRVKADTIDSVRYNQDYLVFLPVQTVDITGYEFSKSEGTGWGLHAGADVSYFFSRVVGVGACAEVEGQTAAIEYRSRATKQLGRLFRRGEGHPIGGFVIVRDGVEDNLILWRVLAC